jgi:hypothetical protein
VGLATNYWKEIYMNICKYFVENTFEKCFEGYIFGTKLHSMPEISRFYGVIIYMFFKDHNPLHFKVK